MNMSFALRGLVSLSMVFSIGLVVPGVAGVAEASGAKARSSVERRLRPGQGYFANSPQTRARTSAPAVSRPMMPAAPMMQQGTSVARVPQVQSGQIVSRQFIPQQGVVVQQPGVIVQQPGVIVQQPGVIVQQPGVMVQQPIPQPMPIPQNQWITAPQR
jgi:hypothetical protein